MVYNMKQGIIGLLHCLILIPLLCFENSVVASDMETDDSSRKAVEVPAEESLFAANGVSVKFLFVIEGFSVEQKFATPMGVFYDNYHNEIYIADTGNDQVAVFDAGGQPRFQIRSVHGLKAPLDLVVNSENQIYVSQMEKSCLQLFDFPADTWRICPRSKPRLSNLAECALILKRSCTSLIGKEPKF
jgi:hypothetical protein